MNHFDLMKIKHRIKELREIVKEDDTPTNRELLRLEEQALEDALRWEVES